MYNELETDTNSTTGEWNAQTQFTPMRLTYVPENQSFHFTHSETRLAGAVKYYEETRF